MKQETHRYQRWPGRHQQAGRLTSLWAIVTTGIRLQYNRRFVKPLLLVAPAIVIGICLVLYMLSMLEILAGQPQAQGLYDMARVFLGVDLSAVSQIGALRETIWRTIFAFTIQIEFFAVMIILARIGPGLISNDIKERALTIYFAHPINPKSYLIGKWIVAATFIASVTMIPNLMALIISTFITGGLPDLSSTISLGLNIVIAGIGVMFSCGVVMLALSSVTSDSRYVTVGWLAVCMMPTVAQVIIRVNIPPEKVTNWLGSISLQENASMLTEKLFGLQAAWANSGLPEDAFTQVGGNPIDPFYPAMVIGGITLLAAAFCYRRIVTFSQSAASA